MLHLFISCFHLLVPCFHLSIVNLFHISIFQCKKMKIEKTFLEKRRKNQRTFRPFHFSRPRRRFLRGYYCNIEHRMSHISISRFHLPIRVSKRIDLLALGHCSIRQNQKATAFLVSSHALYRLAMFSACSYHCSAPSSPVSIQCGACACRNQAAITKTPHRVSRSCYTRCLY